MKKKSRIAIVLTIALIISILPVNSLTVFGYTGDEPSYFLTAMREGYIEVYWDDPDEEEMEDLLFFELYVKAPGSSDYTLLQKIDAYDMEIWQSDDYDDAYYDYHHYAKTPGQYSYKLRAAYEGYGDEEESDYIYSDWVTDSVKYANLNRPTAKTKYMGDTSVEVSWSKVDGADGYFVYRGIVDTDIGEDDYKETISSPDITSWTSSGVRKNVEYYYVVVPYVIANGEAVEGLASEMMFCTAGVVKSKITSIYTSAGSAVLKWSKNANADGYEIFRAASASGTYQKIKTIKNQATTTFTDKKKKPGKRYYYKVRAYATIEGSKYYGAFSASKSVKISSKTLTQQQARKAYLALKNESLYYPKTLIVNGIFSGTIKGEKAIMIYYSAKNGYGVRSWDYFTYFPSSRKWNHSYTPVALKKKTTLNKSKIIHWS